MSEGPSIHVLDMHTGGEPVRVIRGGYPPVPGTASWPSAGTPGSTWTTCAGCSCSSLAAITTCTAPCWCEPSLPGADLAVLFMHNEGYSTMCGHATIALGRYAVDYGLVPKVEPVTAVGLECPCGAGPGGGGRGGRPHRAGRFASVPAFLLAGRCR